MPSTVNERPAGLVSTVIETVGVGEGAQLSPVVDTADRLRGLADCARCAVEASGQRNLAVEAVCVRSGLGASKMSADPDEMSESKTDLRADTNRVGRSCRVPAW